MNENSPQIPQNLQEFSDLQVEMLGKFLDDTKVGIILSYGFEEIDGQTLRQKFIDFFEENKETNFEKRLLKTYDTFNKWLAGDDWERINKAASFCIPILRVIAGRASELKNRFSVSEDNSKVIQLRGS